VIVRYTAEAYGDLAEILAYLRNENPRAAALSTKPVRGWFPWFVFRISSSIELKMTEMN
jgi:hypothetical protein